MKWFPDRSTICLSEVPGEISLSIVLAGCGHCCAGCHSPEYRDKNAGVPFDWEEYGALLRKYSGKASCIVFFNGEYDPELLGRLAWLARLMGYRTCLYSGFGLNELPEELKNEFTYLKTGVYREELGGLTEKTTNQRFWKKGADGVFIDITKEFWREEV